jgi:hypothetical protein
MIGRDKEFTKGEKRVIPQWGIGGLKLHERVMQNDVFQQRQI